MGFCYAYFSPSMDVSSIPIKIDLHNFNWYLAIRMCKFIEPIHFRWMLVLSNCYPKLSF